MTCTKRVWTNEHKARVGARTATEAHGEAFRPYRCPECGRWHVSTTTAMPDIPRGPGRSAETRPPKARTRDELEALAAALRARRDGTG